MWMTSISMEGDFDVFEMFLSKNKYPFLDPSKSSSLTTFNITNFIEFMQSLKAIQSSWFVFLFAYSKFMHIVLMVFLKVLTFSYCITYCTTLIYIIIFPRFQASTTKKPYVGRHCNYNYYIETICYHFLAILEGNATFLI